MAYDIRALNSTGPRTGVLLSSARFSELQLRLETSGTLGSSEPVGRGKEGAGSTWKRGALPPNYLFRAQGPWVATQSVNALSTMHSDPKHNPLATYLSH